MQLLPSFGLTTVIILPHDYYQKKRKGHNAGMPPGSAEGDITWEIMTETDTMESGKKNGFRCRKPFFRLNWRLNYMRLIILHFFSFLVIFLYSSNSWGNF